MKPYRLVFILLCLTLTGCSKESEVGIPEITHNGPRINAVFNQPGSRMAEVDWNGDIGTISLLNSDPEFSVDASNGDLFWNGLTEPDKSYSVTVVAKNSAGEASEELEVVNIFKAKFGGYRNKDIYSELLNENNYWALIFYPKGEGITEVNGWAYDGEASWEWLSDHKIRFYSTEEDFFTGNNTIVIYEVDMKKEASSGKLWLEGYWYENEVGSTIQTAKGKVKMEYVSIE